MKHLMEPDPHTPAPSLVSALWLVALVTAVILTLAAVAH